MRLRRPRSRVVAVGSDAGRKPRNTAEAPEIAAVLAGVCPARGWGSGAPRTGIVWGFPRAGPRCAPPSTQSLRARAVGSAQVLRIDGARSAEAAVRRRPEDQFLRASLRHGLTHRGEDRP